MAWQRGKRANLTRLWGGDKVACSADGAGYLLDAGVVECVSGSESIAKASQIVSQTTTPAPFGATKNEVSALV